MPQASPELRAKFPGWDAVAMNALRENFTCDRGVFRKKDPNYHPTDREWDAIDYLFQEGDFGYEEVEENPARTAFNPRFVYSAMRRWFQ